MTDFYLYTKLSSLPDELKQQVSEFIDRLTEKELKKKGKSPDKRTLGLAKGKIEMMDNFDDPIEDFKDYQ